MTKLHRIDHFVVLMLENRSFDNILGGFIQSRRGSTASMDPKASRTAMARSIRCGKSRTD